MDKAKSAVRSIEITRAVRSAKLGNFNIKKRQGIGFLDGALVAVADSPGEVLNKMLSKLGTSKLALNSLTITLR
jgi:dihydroxyacetone kinase-like predicted kinase